MNERKPRFHAIVAALAVSGALAASGSLMAQDTGSSTLPFAESVAEPATQANDQVQAADEAAPVAPAERVADFASQEAAIDLGSALSDNRVSNPAEPGTAWFTASVVNGGAGLTARVLMAVDPPWAGISLFPAHRRLTLREAASSDAGVVIEQATAFGDNALRVIVPPQQTSTLALHFDGVNGRPQVLAWTESALIVHNRQAAILAGLVGGLLAAALAFAAGAAVLGGGAYAKWATTFLGALLLAGLTAAGMFDGGMLTAIGGPHALFALALALAIAGAIFLLDHVAPYEAFLPGAHLWADRFAVVILIIGLAAFFGVPGAGFFVRVTAMIGAVVGVGYLVHCGRLGVAAARRLAPGATIFALVLVIGAFNALGHAWGLFGINLVAPMALTGFASIGAILVALTTAVASAEPTVGRMRAMRKAHRGGDGQTSATDDVLAESREHSAVAASHQGVFDLDLDSRLLSLSIEAAAILDLSLGALELSEENWLQRIHADDREIYQKALNVYRKNSGVAFRLEFRARGAGGKMRWFELRATMTGQATEAERCLGLIADVSARKAVDQTAAATQTDPLTGLGNRTALFDQLQAMRARFPRLVLVVFDLDRFKSVNASLGPDGADALLGAVAKRLTEKFKGESSVFRIGGDMFGVIMPRGNAELEALGGRVLDTMNAPFSVFKRDVFLPASIGVASGGEALDPQDFLARAELAMVQAKREGGGGVCVYGEALAKEASLSASHDPVALDTDLRRALEQGEMEIHYQPIVRLDDGSVAGFEALLRWQHKERGLIEPDDFIAHAERSGLIIPLGRLALRCASEDLARWQKFFPQDPPLFVSVNVSWRQIASKGFAKELETLLHGSGLIERSLHLEMTESALMSSAATAEVTLKRLRKLGAGIAIDDFGTGHSSLSRLRRFSFDVIKIDKSFLPLGEKDEDTKILASIVSLAHELGLTVIVEGVEREEDARRLRAMGCKFAQGYLFGMALPASDATTFIAMAHAR